MDRLVLAGFPIAQVFLFGNGESHHTLPLQVNSHSVNSSGSVRGTAVGLRRGMAIGNLTGAVSGLLLGTGLVALPGVGQLALASTIAFVLLSGGVCTAAGGLVGAMVGLSLTEKQAQAYDQEIARGKVLLLIEGTVLDLDRARSLLQESPV